ncbi:MAG: relaxase/mobilization nuclease domain-containing protein [Sphingobacterium sp.]
MIAKQKIHQANNFMGAFDYNDRKMDHKDPKQRAELLDHNFIQYNRNSVVKEVAMIGKLRRNLTRDAYHVSLNFAKSDKLDNEQLVSLTQEYLKGMGFTENLYAIWKHNDADHLHVHALASRIKYDGSVVSDSNNYKRSEALCRKLEAKYGLQPVQSSKEALERSPNKDELEMIQRTGYLSNRMMMQEAVKSAVRNSNTVAAFISNCEKQGIHLLFNQSASTGRVSGITYVMEGFLAKGQKLGNMYKWNNINQKIGYEQSRDRKAISETNDRTRARFEDLLAERDTRNKKGYSEANSTDRHPESRDQQHQKHKEHDGLNVDYARAVGNKERIPKNESVDRDLFSNGIGALLGNFGGFSNTVSHDEVDEGMLKRKRRRKKGRRR